MTTPSRPIGIYYEHQDWFRPLFAELERRGTPHKRIDARQHQYDVAAPSNGLGLLFNRMSPSAYLRGNRHGIFYTLAYLQHLERVGTRVVNGYRAFTVETSKALQLSLLESLGLPYPRARVINHASQALDATRALRFPVVVKANIGGSGAGIVRFDTPEALERAAAAGEIDLGIDETALVGPPDRIKARRTHYEDWIAAIIFNHLFSGADAYVAANLWDFRTNIGVVAKPGSAGIYASIRLR